MATLNKPNGIDWTKENTPEKMQQLIREGKAGMLSDSDGSELSEVDRKIRNAPKGKL